MDIAALSAVSANAKVQQEASVLLMRKVMDVAEQNNQGMQRILQSATGQSIDPKLGKTIDVSV